MSGSENVIPVEVEAERDSQVEASVEARDFELVVDEPESMGGTRSPTTGPPSRTST